MKNIPYYKNLFLVAGLWNLGASIGSLLAMMAMPDFFFSLFEMPQPSSMFPFHATFALVFVFGIGYIMVSRNTEQNHGIVSIGIMGKGLFFLSCLAAFLVGEANYVLVVLGAIDLVFVYLFVDFLRKMRAMAAEKISS